MSRYNNNNENESVTVKEFNIPKDKLETIQKILDSKMMWSNKKDMLLALTGIKPLCCVCGQISSPLYQVRYSGPEAVRLEVYCSTHIESVYQKTKDSTSEELAEIYNCQIGEIDHTQPNPWD
jgi:hypothetical protein